MNDTEITLALREADRLVPVPAYDPAPVAKRTARLRRRRRTARAVAGGAGVVAVVAVAALGPGALRDAPSTVGPSFAGPSDAALAGVPVSRDGNVVLVGADGTITDTGLAGSLVGVSQGRVVLLDGDRLTGGPGGDVTGVESAFADPSGVTYQRDDATIGRAGPGGVDASVATGRLVAAGEQGVVLREGDDLSVVSRDGLRSLELGSDGTVPVPVSVDLAGGIVAVADRSTVQLFALDGTRLSGMLGGTVGALSGDGRAYAYAPSAAELTAGMRPGLGLIDTRTERMRRLPLPASPALDLAWHDDVAYVLTDDPDGRTLWACAEACRALLVDDSGSLSLR